jgi:hypothetical protein
MVYDSLLPDAPVLEEHVGFAFAVRRHDDLQKAAQSVPNYLRDYEKRGMDDRDHLVSMFEHIIQYLEMRKGNIDEQDPLEYIMEIARDVERRFGKLQVEQPWPRQHRG